MKKKVKKISAKRAVLTSLLVDVLDVFVNLAIAIVTGSVVMIAETIQGIADFISASFVYIGLKRSSKKTTKKYPLGYGRALYIWTFLATIILFLFTSTITFYLGLDRFLNPEPIKNIILAYTALILFTLTNGYSFSVSSRRLLNGKRYKKLLRVFKNSDLIETKTVLILDTIGTTAAIIGLIALVLYGVTGDLRFDGLGAMGIGVSVMILAIFLIKDTKSLLIGKSASPEMEKNIKECIIKTKNVKKLLKLSTLNIGLGKILINLEVHLEDRLVTDDIEKTIYNLERKIKKKFPEVKYINVEIRARKTKE